MDFSLKNERADRSCILEQEREKERKRDGGREKKGGRKGEKEGWREGDKEGERTRDIRCLHMYVQTSQLGFEPQPRNVP